MDDLWSSDGGMLLYRSLASILLVLFVGLFEGTSLALVGEGEFRGRSVMTFRFCPGSDGL